MTRNSSFGKALADVRKLAGLTQNQFAALVDVSPALIASLETRGTMPRPELLDRVFEATGASRNALLEGKAETFDGFPYTAQFFADYARGLRNSPSGLRDMKAVVLFDFEQLLAAAERDGILVPTLLRLSRQILEFANRTGLANMVRKSLIRDVAISSLEGKYAASITTAAHIPKKKFVILKGESLKGKAFIRVNGAVAFGHASKTHDLSLRSKAPYWPYEVEPEELPVHEIRRFLRKRTLAELNWFKHNTPSLFRSTSVKPKGSATAGLASTKRVKKRRSF